MKENAMPHINGKVGDIRKEIVNTLYRIILFIIVYLLLICLGLALLAGMFFITRWTLLNADVVLYMGRAIIFHIVLLAGLWALGGIIIFYLIKPLFTVHKMDNSGRYEVHKEEAPELFNMIYEVADMARTAKPNKVFLSTDVNACVFYDRTSLWTLFFPAKKNLEIGLGLFTDTNVQEVKSILAHEFGHFSQKSMKMDSAVYLMNIVIRDLVYTEDSFDKKLDSWARSSTTAWRICGGICLKVVNWIKAVNIKMYGFIQKGYLALSRQMEYDADRVAVEVTGAQSFISALSKIETTSEYYNLYLRLLGNYANAGKKIENYFEGYAAIEHTLKDNIGYNVDYHTTLEKPLSDVENISKLELKDIWSSHPSTKDRITNIIAASQQYVGDINMAESVSIIPAELRPAVGRWFISARTNEMKEIVVTDVSEFANWAISELDSKYITKDLQPYLNRNICPFDIEEADKLELQEESPFTTQNAEVLLEYEAALSDNSAMHQIASGNTSVKEFRYDGILYKAKKAPIKVHDEYLKSLGYKAQSIDMAIFKCLDSCVKPHMKIRWAYSSLMYSQWALHHVGLLQEKQQGLINRMNSTHTADENDISTFSLEINNLERNLKQIITEVLDYERLSVFMKKEDMDSLHQWATVNHNPMSSINVDSANEMVHLAQYISDIVSHLSNIARNQIIEVAKFCINNKENSIGAINEKYLAIYPHSSNDQYEVNTTVAESSNA